MLHNEDEFLSRAAVPSPNAAFTARIAAAATPRPVSAIRRSVWRDLWSEFAALLPAPVFAHPVYATAVLAVFGVVIGLLSAPTPDIDDTMIVSSLFYSDEVTL